ncbi:hypothetical protein PYR78_02970 [Acinetobacter johnsonii]|nr:hypothetical protein PYR78_02970 [Acinetobacter johnsonii]
MKLLSYYKDKDSNEFGLRVLSLKDSEELENQINEFEPQVLVAELESENLRVIKLAEKIGVDLDCTNQRMKLCVIWKS